MIVVDMVQCEKKSNKKAISLNSNSLNSQKLHPSTFSTLAGSGKQQNVKIVFVKSLDINPGQIVSWKCFNSTKFILEARTISFRLKFKRF